MPESSSTTPVRPRSPAEYARCLLEILGNHLNEHIKIDVVLLLFSMIEHAPVDNAVLYASGESHGVGALRMENAKAVYQFIDTVSTDIVLAAYIKGEFNMYQYPYYSRARDQWVFLPAIDPKGLPGVRDGEEGSNS